jgi:hypothetical protein
MAGSRIGCMRNSEAEMARAAERLLDRYGKNAATEAGKRADSRRKAGKRHLEIKWLTVLMMVEETCRRQRAERRVRPRLRGLFHRFGLGPTS